MRFYLSLVLSSTCLIADQAPPAPPAPPKPTEAAETLAVPMELIGNRPIIRVTIGDTGPFAWLVAPEAEAALIDQAFAVEVRLKPQDGRTGSVLEGVSFGNSKPRHVPVNVTDMAKVLPEMGPASRPKGLISATLWPDSLVTLDYRRWRLEVQAGSLPNPNGRDIFDLKPDARQFRLTLGVAGHAIPCRLDPVFPGGLLIPGSYVTLLPLIGQPVSVGSMTTATGRVMVRESQLGGGAMLGMFEFAKPFVRFSDAGDVCRVGGQRLIGFAVTYDLTNARVRLTR